MSGMIKVAHLTGSVSSQGGGIAPVLQALVTGEEKRGVRTSVFAPDDGGTPLAGWPPGQPQTLPARRLGPVVWAKNLRRRVAEGAPDLVHTHGLWGQSSLVAGRLSSSGRLRVVSPHGMLDPWALKNSRLRKEVALRLFERRLLASADCLHALCRSEAESIRQMGFRNPVAVIPNGVDLPEPDAPGSSRDHDPRVLLFLGRLHPKKGVPGALRAFAQFLQRVKASRDAPPWQLVIAGWDQGGHEAELKELCRELSLSFAERPAAEWLNEPKSRDGASAGGRSNVAVVFVGSAFDATKDQLLRRADAFILPSFSEGLPVAVLEAWAYQLPVLMTDHCNLPEGFEAGAALRIETGADDIARGMWELLSSPSRLRSLGQNGHALVKQRFTWPQIAGQMVELYTWLLKGGRKPAFVEAGPGPATGKPGETNQAR